MNSNLSKTKLAVCTLALSLASAGAYAQDLIEHDFVTNKADCTTLNVENAPLSELSTTTMCQACLSPLIGKSGNYVQVNQPAPVTGDPIGATISTIACATPSSGSFSPLYVGLFSAGCQLRHGLFSQQTAGLVCQFAKSCRFTTAAP